MNSVESSVYLFCISFHRKLFSFCPAACLQAGTRRIYEGTNTVDLDWFLRQSALHQPHRGQNGSSGSVGWGVQGVCSRAFIEKEVISCSASEPHRKKTDSCHFDTLQVQEYGKHTNRIGNYRRRKNGFSNEPLPLHHVSVAVLGLWSTLFALWQFSLPHRWVSAVLGPVRVPQIASCLMFHPLSFILVYFTASHVQGMAQSVCLSGNPAWGSYLSQEISCGGGWVLLSLVTCLWDPCLQVCDTGGIVGVRCVPAAASAASAQYPVWNWQAHSWLLCPCFWQCWQSEELECESKSSSVAPIFLDAFATEKFSRHFKCILYSFP